MIRIFGADYTAKDYAQLSEIFNSGIDCICCSDCAKCNYDKVCINVHKAITHCDTMRNKLIGNKGKRK